MKPRRLKAVPALPSDPRMWKRLMNHVYLCEEDEMFAWLRDVRDTVEEAEKSKGRAA